MRRPDPTSRTSFSPVLFRLLLLTGLLMAVSGCDIEESEFQETGSISVRLFESEEAEANEILDAQITLDGDVQSQTTPAVLSNVSVGSHSITLFAPGFDEVTETVDVRVNETANLNLVTEPVEIITSILLENTPDGTLMLLNGLPLGVTPPALFDSIGFGTFAVSAYLEGHATDYPALWTVTLSSEITSDTVRPTFTELAPGNLAGALAPIFSLPTLADMDDSLSLTHYRGKIVLLSFFFASCVPCREEFPSIQDVYEDAEFSPHVEFFAIDGLDAVSSFLGYQSVVNELGLEFAFLYDGTWQTRQTDYGVFEHPQNFLIDRTGVIRHRWGSITYEQLRSAIRDLIAETDTL